MKEQYCIIIWEKALWCKNKIINDLNNDFIIDNCFYIEWNKAKFHENLESFYGRKIYNTANKIQCCGDGKFLLVIFEDKNPKYGQVNTMDGNETVNINVFNKKNIYRKWTAGCHRIHVSNTPKETIHDLTILLGNNYDNTIKAIQNNSIISTNTIGVKGFESVNEIEKSLLNSIDCVYKQFKNYSIIITKYKYDVIYLLQCKKEKENNLYSININSNIYYFYIFGENDSDLPANAFNLIKDTSFVDDLNNVLNDYQLYIANKSRSSHEIEKLFSKYNLKNEFNYINGANYSINVSATTIIKRELKLLVAKLIYYIKK